MKNRIVKIATILFLTTLVTNILADREYRFLCKLSDSCGTEPTIKLPAKVAFGFVVNESVPSEVDIMDTLEIIDGYFECVLPGDIDLNGKFSRFHMTLSLPGCVLRSRDGVSSKKVVRDGYFYFESTSLIDCMDRIERKYEISTIDTVKLYTFTKHRFSNCGSSGSHGPNLDDCRRYYDSPGDWDEDKYFFDVINGIQYWRVPRDGVYHITAAGAKGGDGFFNGGKGSIIDGFFYLTKGERLKILVGQKGVNGQSSIGDFNEAGGGGASFVVRETDFPLIIAGGGGGASACPDGVAGENAMNEQIGCGNGGHSSEGLNHGGGGGGLFEDGMEGSGITEGGLCFTKGAIGGHGDVLESTAGSGGFGGGGGGSNACGGGAGGGGGFSGGDAGERGKPAKGGSSFNASYTNYNYPENISENDDITYNDDHGYVIIEYLANPLYHGD